MVINNNNVSGNVKFVSYTGKYPNLCSGVLTLEIEGIEYKFGHSWDNYNIGENTFNDNNCDKFWSSGGSCGIHTGCNHEEWVIDTSKLPPNIRKYVYEIDEVFNDNVTWGCCGGCL